jgi:hypothetical protein
MLIGQLVLVVEAVEEAAHHHLAMRVGCQNHVADALNQVDALSAKHFLEKSAQKYYF